MAGYPYIMQSALFSGSVVGSVLAPDERVFRNTTPYYLRVHRISVHAAGGDDTRYETLQGTGVVAVTGVRLSWAIRFGHTEVTSGWAPMAATTWRANVDEPAPAVYFSQPVYLAPGDRLDVKVKYEGGIASASPAFFLSAHCSAVDRPDAIRVPALYGWEGGERSANSGEFSEEVPVGTLYNEFDEAMHIERIIGRLALFGGFSTPPSGGDPAGSARAYQAIRQVFADMELHDGSKITRDPTPFGALFDLARQSWLTNFSLPSKGYIKTTVSGNLVQTNGTALFRPYIGLLGYRTIG